MSHRDEPRQPPAKKKCPRCGRIARRNWGCVIEGSLECARWELKMALSDLRTAWRRTRRAAWRLLG